MATIEVSSWTGLVSAIGSAASGDTIKLTNNINCNDEIPEGVASTIAIPVGVSLTIDGSYEEDGITKNYEIRNLRTFINSPVSIFQIRRPGNSAITHTIKNIDFVNLILNKPLLDVEDYYTAIHTFNIRNCRFTGKRYDYLINRLAGDSSGAQGYVNVNIYNSYFNVPYYGTSNTKAPLCSYYFQSSSYFRSYMYNCRIKETYTGTWAPNGNTKACCGVYNTALSGCRVEGEVVNGYYSAYHSSDVLSLLTPSIQNVYDVDFKLMPAYQASANVTISAFKGVVKVPVRKYGTNEPYGNNTPSTGVILATESQMQDTTWLIQQGFDVVPSNA